MLQNLHTALLLLTDGDLPLPFTAAPLWSEACLPVIRALAYFSIFLASAGVGRSSSA